MTYKQKHPSYFLFLFVFVFLFSIIPARTAKTEDIPIEKLTAQDIISRMKQAYFMSETYSDRGVVTSVFISKEGTRTIEKPFTTAFVRPDRFRFEYKENNNPGQNSHYIAYKNGNDVKVYWNIGPDMVSKIQTLSEALAAAAGISSGAARTVPTMLDPSESQFRNAMTYYNPRRIEDTFIDGVECFQISDPADYRRLTIWIGKKDFLLRKIYREQDFKDFQGEETTVYEPTISGVVKDKMLEFNSPTSK